MNNQNSLTVEKLNEIFSSLPSLARKYKVVQTQETPNYGDETYDGDNKQTIIYDLEVNDLFLKVDKECDSYGENEEIISIKFVEKKIKEVITFE